ncbi:pirin family protein [Shewanella litorisediminis]|uniref:Pirin family protein n=1 Tax=Shewanella litorisediminis TaxID=1173586 RepID=A0ABX7G1W5_9GAMM|nr:pirin family protein [Shewanella litorisediminis]MCL2918384.1 pirin family protein [Shewanella litorisediminis]QRH01222.1 pirin family protein [Shewanella litorisediminis]
MKIKTRFFSRPAMDGDGVNIRRVADFNQLQLDPFLMVDEIRSDDKSDFIGGFPPHPHRGIETFTYIRKGGFEHRDHMGNVRAIRAGDVQWMSTGSGVIHSEMPLADASDGLHGFQIWLNMPAKDKMRPARYLDSTALAQQRYPSDKGADFYPLAGRWSFEGETIDGLIQGLAANGAVADLSLTPGGSARLDMSERGFVGLYLYQGALRTEDGKSLFSGEYLVLQPGELELMAAEEGAGMLLFAGEPIGEAIVHMGPFVMNTEAEIRQAIHDYQTGRFGALELPK